MGKRSVFTFLLDLEGFVIGFGICNYNRTSKIKKGIDFEIPLLLKSFISFPCFARNM